MKHEVIVLGLLFLHFTVILYACSTEFSPASCCMWSPAYWPRPCLCLVFLINLLLLRADICRWGAHVQAPWEIRDRHLALGEINTGQTSFPTQHPPVKNRKSNLCRPLHVGMHLPAVSPVHRSTSLGGRPFANQEVAGEWWRGLASSQASLRTHFKFYLVVYFLCFCGYRWQCSWKQRVEQKPHTTLTGQHWLPKIGRIQESGE